MNPYEELPNALAPEDEQVLLRQDRSDLEIRDKLLLHSLKDAIKYAATCCRGTIATDELLSLCSIALLAAIPNYDPNHKKHLRLISFAKPYIRGQIQRAWRDRNPVTYGPNVPEKTGEEEDFDQRPEEDYEDPDFEGIHVRERWEWVKPHLNKLSETEMRVLILLFESRFSMADVGRMLDCTRENVRITKVRALKKIRNGLYRDKKLLNPE